MPGTFVYTPAAGTVLNAGAAQTLSVTFTPTDTANYTTATATRDDHRAQGDADDHLGDAGGIVYGTALSATQLNATASVPGTFVYTPAAGTVLIGRRGADAVGDVHADRRRELHDGDGDRRDHRAEGDADDHLGDAGGHRLRHGAERDAAERDGERAGHASSTRRRRARCSRPARPDAVGDLHADRRGELHDGDGDGRRSPC